MHPQFPAGYRYYQRVQLQKLHFQHRKKKTSDESAQEIPTDLQRLPLEACPKIEARAAARGRSAVSAQKREQERNRRVREAFINGRPFKLQQLFFTQPKDAAIDVLCARAASPMIIDQFCPEDDDTAFNEI